MQVVILAGGLATRMRPRTLTMPKFLLPVAGRPFGDWLLERIASHGFHQVLLCIGYLGDDIRSVVGDGRRFGLDVDYAEDGPTLLGTGGALRRALPRLANTFLVTYGDSYLPFDYAEPLRILERHADADGVMAVFRNEGKWDTSNTILRIDQAGDPWVARYQKTQRGDPEAELFDYIDYGATALRRETIARIPENTPWGLDRVQAELSQSGRLRACVARARFFEIGSEEGLAELERDLSKRGASP